MQQRLSGSLEKHEFVLDRGELQIRHSCQFVTAKSNNEWTHCMYNLWCRGDAVRYEIGGGLSAQLTPLPAGCSFSR